MNIKISVNDIVVGAVQSLTITEGRGDKATPVEIQANRVRFDRLKIEEIFNKGLIHGASQYLPMQIAVEHKDSTINIHNVWLKNPEEGYTNEELQNIITVHAFTVTDWILVDELSLVAEEVSVSGFFKHS